MLRRPRRTRRPALALVPLLLAASLSACGDDEGDSGVSGDEERLDAVEITGDVGKQPKVEWNGVMEAGDIVAETVVEGDGEELADGDQVVTHIWIGNGFTKTKAYSTYDEGGSPETLTVGDDLAPIFEDALEGRTIGSRVAVTASADEAFGEVGNPQLNIANKDTVLVLVDLVEEFVPPKPEDVGADEMPGIVFGEGGDPVRLRFKGLPKPKADDDLKRYVVREGKGKTLTQDSTVKADYLGMVYGAGKPFDESFSKKPAEFSLQQVVQGWTYGLAGVKVGSRVLLSIPPDLGYGDQAQAAIPAGSTLYFVVDIVSAK
ncbi:FKBP-type peptidyl-prolyl cis-trans isomerase [Nocardioides deserti]|uniref:Peptidyl-prolyl cis-trans isomerase n=1 Tax=Nocardioides deserti TaxID=1588644 RepID=A0ABR6U4B0_9ACTN|nr:FKBP-type peptidyl-prolyl cis-trans isomerase [Nocardioides deserti]MBC2959271.1 FKBP-type peptidyl-prolyl cis-trans isomerase [Nocardioides deserti]GGO68198.1 peptidylprolyl isomerase [Nocardioides deserti]